MHHLLSDAVLFAAVRLLRSILPLAAVEQAHIVARRGLRTRKERDKGYENDIDVHLPLQPWQQQPWQQRQWQQQQPWQQQQQPRQQQKPWQQQQQQLC